MLTLLSPFLKGVPARQLGIGTGDDVGYVQCPDPDGTYTCGGTVVFELRRERLERIPARTGCPPNSLGKV
jgi:hypothetical protein